MKRLNFKDNKKRMIALENKERQIDLQILTVRNEIDYLKKRYSEASTRHTHSIARVSKIEREINQYFNGDLS